MPLSYTKFVLGVKKDAENFVVLRLKYIVEEFQSEFNDLWEKNAPE